MSLHPCLQHGIREETEGDRRGSKASCYMLAPHLVAFEHERHATSHAWVYTVYTSSSVPLYSCRSGLYQCPGPRGSGRSEEHDREERPVAISSVYETRKGERSHTHLFISIKVVPF
jgi:hypothetical protein